MPNGKPFIDETLLYLDDGLLGLILWNRGYKVKYVPVNAGIHFASMTTRGLIGTYYGFRAVTALLFIVNTRYYKILLLRLLRRRFYYFTNHDLYKAFKDGIRLGKMLSNIIGVLDLYYAPYVKANPLEAIMELTLVLYLFKKGNVYNIKPADLAYESGKCHNL